MIVMKETWNQKAGSFEDDLKKVSDATGESFSLSDGNKEKSLKEILKTDKARVRAFLSILKKVDESKVELEESENQKIEADFSKELKTLHILDAVDSFIQQYKEGEHSTLEPRQIESLTKIAAFLRSGKKRGYLELPTGLGKTVIFSELIESLKDVSGIKVLVVGSGNINAMQNRQKIEAFGGEEAGQYFGGKKEIEGRVTVCNYNGLRSGIQEGHFKDGDFDLILLDEVHDGLGVLTQELIQKTFKEETIIGFSATATYETSKGKKVSNFLPIEIDRMGVVEAVEGNLLAGFKVEIIKIPTVMKPVKVQGGDYISSELEKQINTPERNKHIVDSYSEFYRKEGNKAVTFCVGIQHTKDLAAAFEKEGISAGVLTSEVSSIDEREALLQKWKNGEIEVLCGSKLVWQALDETEANIGLNVTPSMSEKDVIQRGGRLLRRSQLINKKKSTIVEFLDEWRETKNRPVFYSEILEVAEAEPEKWKDDEEKEGTDSVVEVEEVPKQPTLTETEKTKEKKKKEYVIRYVNAEEIMSISNQNRKFRNEGYAEYAPLQWMSANIIAVELGVKTKEVEDAIYIVARKISVHQLDINCGAYLSSFGIKRIFFAPKIVDMLYEHFTGSTRAEKIARKEIKDVKDFSLLEEESAQLERGEDRRNSRDNVDLNWRDYDLLPSFTLEGESLDDEEEGINIGDTSELHPSGESIEGQFNDVIGYRYATAPGGAVYNSKVVYKKPKQQRQMKVTWRYGVHLKDNLLGETSEDPGDKFEDKDMFEIVRGILEDPNVLSEREKKIIIMKFFEADDDNEEKTLESIGKVFGVTRERIRGIKNEALRKIRRAIREKDVFGKSLI